MQTLKRKWKIKVVHHSHTDIGYTERQEKIERAHVDYIRQALQLRREARSGKRKDLEGFKWTCETFWMVERFLEQCSDEESKELAEAIRSGDIGLSGNYLNMTELIDMDVLGSMTSRIVDYARSNGLSVESAMSADINGHGWGFAQCLVDAGIRNLFTCVHPHHGMFPLGRKQTPFWWEAPSGGRLLVWNGDHYMLGNDLGFNPQGLQSYIIRDEFASSEILHGIVIPVTHDHWEVAEKRISRYLGQLEDEEYPFDFVPITVSGFMSDNSPPNGCIASFIHEWNKQHGENILLEMATLDDVFREVRRYADEIPVHRGDWPDWWSDGVNSTAVHTQVFRDAQRKLKVVKRLDPDRSVVSSQAIREMEYQLTMYAEHTWGHSHSVSDPWLPLVQALALRKEAYAANAARMVDSALDSICAERGEAVLSPRTNMRFKAVNAGPGGIQDLARLIVDFWEAPELQSGFIVIDEASGETLPHQIVPVTRGLQISVPVSLQAGEEKIFRIVPERRSQGATTNNVRLLGTDGVYDLEDMLPGGRKENGVSFTATSLDTPFVHIGWTAGAGIVSWVDKRTGRNLLKEDRDNAAFTPVYEVTPVSSRKEMITVRRDMGRNRKGMLAVSNVGQLTGARLIENGELYITVELHYETAGMSDYSVILQAYAHEPRVDVSVRFLKQTVWEPENVYIALPFEYGADSALWLDKSFGGFRPSIDQLPGTCRDYYCIQDGLVSASEGAGVAIATPDAPLVQTGTLKHGLRRLQGQGSADQKGIQLYSWVLSNYWETNFKATTGGFYEFRYLVRWGQDSKEPDDAIEQCRAMNVGTLCFRIH